MSLHICLCIHIYMHTRTRTHSYRIYAQIIYIVRDRHCIHIVRNCLFVQVIYNISTAQINSTIVTHLPLTVNCLLEGEFNSVRRRGS